MHVPSRRIASLIPLALVGFACGGEPAPAKSADDRHSHEESTGTGRGGLESSAEVGALDLDAVARTFEGALRDLQGCLNAGARRVELLGGDIAFYVEVDTSGRARHVHAERSTIGDRDTERCMFEALKKRTWPAVKGGEKGLARNSFGFDMPNDVRPPVEWDSGQVSEAISEVSGKLSECGASRSGELTATVYVDTEGNALAAGVAGSNPSTEQAADCVATVLREVKYPSPGSWPAKVTFAL